MPGGTRVLSYPDTHANPYFRLYYGALGPYGVTVEYSSTMSHRLLDERRGSFDVLHFHWGLELIWRRRRRWRSVLGVASWARFLHRAKRAGIRVVWTAHEMRPVEGARRLDTLGYALCARAADLCIAHSQHVSDRLARRFRVPRSRIVVLPIGTYFGVVPPARGRQVADAELGLTGDTRLLACFGGLRPRKGVEVAMGAVGELGERYRLVVAGQPAVASLEPWALSLERLARGLPNVTLRLDRLEDQALADLIGASDCVLLPYLDILGSSALSLSLALGRGVVASDLPYFREVLALEPEAGVLARPGDPHDVARAIKEFFARPTASRHAAARRLGERLAWEKIIEPVGAWFAAQAHAPGTGSCRRS